VEPVSFRRALGYGLKPFGGKGNKAFLEKQTVNARTFRVELVSGLDLREDVRPNY